MLEIVNKDDNKGGRDFPHRIAELQTKTTIDIVNLACEYNLDPFEVLKIFGSQMIQAAADMRAHCKTNHPEYFNENGDESDKENE